MPLSLVIFDMDGLMLDTESVAGARLDSVPPKN